MKKLLTPLLLVTALGVCVGVGTPAFAVGTCPNASLRVGASANLPDCRAYELVSPDSNHASLGAQPSGQSAQDGQTMAYQTIDAPNTAESASTFNIVRAVRDPASGWSGAALSAPNSAPITSYASFTTWALASNLLSTVAVSDQPLTPGPLPSGQNTFVRRPDGSYRLVTTVGTPFLPGLDVYLTTPTFSWGNADFSNVYFLSAVPQLSTDPVQSPNAYAWSEARGLRLVGILPDGTPAPGGAKISGDVVRVPGARHLRPASEDGKYVAFTAEGKLFLRVDDAQTVELGPAAVNAAPEIPDLANVAADGATVDFTSPGELTSDANTGESGGVPNNAGRDLYRYDTATGHLTDLTVDTNPGDAATGANVQYVASATADNSYVYFTATGVLAGGATPGHTSLYVWHNNQIDFLANADRLAKDSDTSQPLFNITPDGRHAVFVSSDSLTGYRNIDPVTGQRHTEVFEATVGSGVDCVSCRANGTPPTGDSTLPFYHGLPPGGSLRVVSDDGSRVFFHSQDAVVPQASTGLQTVFEYADGKASPVSPLGGFSWATFLDASASGNDVFFATHDELVSNPNGGDFAVYDARVDGGFPASSGRCAGIACQPSATQTPSLPSAASVAFLGEGNVGQSSTSASASKVSVAKVRTIVGTAGSLKIDVPGKGRLSVSGASVRTRRTTVSKAQSIAVRLALTGKAARTLHRKRSLKAQVTVAFSDARGRVSSVTLTVTFKINAASARKGR